MQCSLVHIETLGNPCRLDLVATSVNENKYNNSASQ
jgi:hypothetical protein